MLVNAFDKKIVLAFYNSFLIKKIMLILNTCSSQKKMLSNLTCVLILLIDKMCSLRWFKRQLGSENFVKIAVKYP